MTEESEDQEGISLETEGISLEDILCEVSGLPLVFARIQNTPSWRLGGSLRSEPVYVALLDELGDHLATVANTRLAMVAAVDGCCLVLVPGAHWDPRDVQRRIRALAPHRERLCWLLIESDSKELT